MQLRRRRLQALATLHGGARLEPLEPATILLHKPTGFDTISGKNAAAMLVTPDTQWADDPSGIRPLQGHFHRLTAMVPLDAEASGLMARTRDYTGCSRPRPDQGLR